MAEAGNDWGRVTEDGTVEVRIGDSWHPVGSYPDGTPDEALQLFRRKGDDLEASLSLAEKRLEAGASAKDIAQSVASIRAALETPAFIADVEGMRARVAQLDSRLAELREQQSAQREQALEQARAEREEIVAQIERIAASDLSNVRWKDTSAKVDELFAAWKNHQQTGPKLPKSTGDELWKRFRNARHTIDRAKRAHFQARDKATKEAKAAKTELIGKAEALADKGAAAIPHYRDLLEQWKKAPRGPRQVEDQLWARFKAAGDVLYQAKSAQQEAEDEANAENGVKKQALVEEFSDILTTTDHRTALERLRTFHDRFRQIGPVPRNLLKSLDQKVAAFDKHVKKLEAEHWDKTDPEKQARNQSFLDQVDRQITELEAKKVHADQAGNSEESQRLAGEIETKIAWRAVLVSQ